MALRLMRSIARLVGAEYRVGRCDGPHLAPVSALGHGRLRAPFVSGLPRVPGRGRLPGRSPPPFPSEPVRVDLSRPDEVVRLASARLHVVLYFDHRHPLVAAPVALGCRAFRRVRHSYSNLSARCACAVPCAFSSARRLNCLMSIGGHGASGGGSSWSGLHETAMSCVP